MVRRVFLIGGILLCMLTVLASRGLAAEKLRFGTPSKGALYGLPLLAAEEKGFWKQNGLEGKWTAFRSTTDVTKGIAAGAVDMGYGVMIMMIRAASRGIPLVAVAATSRMDYFIWVSSDSLILKPEHLKGTTFGSSRRGGTFEVFARTAFRGLGVEKDITFISTGGHHAFAAAMKTGKIQSVMLQPVDAIPLMLKGELRPLVSVVQFFPKDRVDNIIMLTRPLADKKPEFVRGGVRSILQSQAFIRQDKPWAQKQLVDVFRYTPKAAAMVFELLIERISSIDPKINRKDVENTINFFVENKFIDKTWKIPPIDKLFTNRFTE